MEYELIYKPEETFKQPFSIDRHKKTFVNYMEAIIDSDGVVEYAVPSHERKLISIILKQNPDMCMKDVEDEAVKQIAVEGWCEWLMRKSKCICVYTRGYMTPKNFKMTELQYNKLKELIDAGLTVDMNFQNNMIGG